MSSQFHLKSSFDLSGSVWSLGHYWDERAGLRMNIRSGWSRVLVNFSETLLYSILPASSNPNFRYTLPPSNVASSTVSRPCWSACSTPQRTSFSPTPRRLYSGLTARYSNTVIVRLILVRHGLILTQHLLPTLLSLHHNVPTRLHKVLPELLEIFPLITLWPNSLPILFKIM